MSTLPASNVWDEQAADYEAYAHPFTRHYAEAALVLAGGVAPGERVLDIAAGTGTLTLAAAQGGAHVLGIDFSPGMVARLASRLEEGGHEGCEARVMDGQALALEDASFEAAFSIFGVMLFPDWEKGISELGRVVRPGGRGCVAVWAREEGAGPSLALHAAYRAAFPERPRLDAAPGMIQLKDEGRLAEAMATAGFSEIRVTRVSGCWRAASPEWVIENMAPFFQRFPAYAELDGAEREHMHTALLTELRRYVRNGAVEIDSDALVAVAVR
jgi:ubiquinone/menaquinone biosynthesis C-methylase UbiE